MNGRDSDTFTLRAATADGREFLYHLVCVTMRDHVVATWGEWDEDWQRDRFAQKFIPET